MRPGECEHMVRVKCLNEMCQETATVTIASESGNRTDSLYWEGWTHLHRRGWLCPTCSEAIVSYNHDAIDKLVKATELLTRAPILGVCNFDDTCCACCSQPGEYDGLLDESIHHELCPWRLAREALASLESQHD